MRSSSSIVHELTNSCKFTDNYFTLQEPSLEIPSEHYVDTSMPVTVEEQGEWLTKTQTSSYALLEQHITAQSSETDYCAMCTNGLTK